MAQHAQLLALENVSKSFRTPDGEELLVLDRINLEMAEGEILALLGKSGSGKSTLLRIIAGLAAPSNGVVRYRRKPVTGPVHGLAMVFQNFALFPWLNVLQNVELGLEALGVPKPERRQRALACIDLIGLDGFESAYPKELSGGMRQRVGFARALVVNPDILLMDEPFSSLDVLTAETLRTDLMELWSEQRIPTKGVLLVSHNIEEAVLMASRILIFASNPGRIQAEIPVPFKHPRDRQATAFRQLVEEIYTIMTSTPGKAAKAGPKREPLTLGYRLPGASLTQVAGLLEALMVPPHQGRADLPYLAQSMQLAVDELFPLIETMEILGLAFVDQGDIELTQAGRVYVNADIQERKQLLARHLRHIPLANHVLRVLEERPGHRAPEERFLRELEDYLSEEEAERVLKVIINWGRHAELFGYDYNSRVLSLETEPAET